MFSLSPGGSHILAPPLSQMKIRWDGIRPSSGGMQTFNSPRFGLTRNQGTRPHQGVDLAAPVGAAIFAIADGVIERVQLEDPYYGISLLLKFKASGALMSHLAGCGIHDSDGFLFALYAHLGGTLVRKNQKVSRGQCLGATGTSGNADQRYPHLHFEIRKVMWPGTGVQGLSQRINPEALFAVDFSDPVSDLERMSRSA